MSVFLSKVSAVSRFVHPRNLGGGLRPTTAKLPSQSTAAGYAENAQTSTFEMVTIGKKAVPLPTLARNDGRVSRREIDEFELAVRAADIGVSELLGFARPLPLGPEKSLAEYCAARMVHRPIIGGIADPTSEEMKILENNEIRDLNKGPLRRLIDGYFKSWSWERSGRIYEMLGVRALRRAVLFYTDFFMFPGLKASLALSGVRCDLATYRSNPTNQHIGRERDLANGRFRKMTIVNEGIHSLAALSLLNFPAPFLAPTFVNLGLCMIQRYNRARVDNTMDMKLGRGPFRTEH